jgi:hypothetical protein
VVLVDFILPYHYQKALLSISAGTIPVSKRLVTGQNHVIRIVTIVLLCEC